MALDNWNDARLDDFYEEFRRMASIVEGIGGMEVKLTQAASDAKHARANVHALRSDMTAALISLRNDITEAALAAAKERRLDRRWFIGTAISCAALIIAAVGIIVGSL